MERYGAAQNYGWSYGPDGPDRVAFMTQTRVQHELRCLCEALQLAGSLNLPVLGCVETLSPHPIHSGRLHRQWQLLMIKLEALYWLCGAGGRGCPPAEELGAVANKAGTDNVEFRASWEKLCRLLVGSIPATSPCRAGCSNGFVA